MELLVTLGPILRYSVTSARRIGVSQLLVSKCKKLACYLKYCFFVSVVQIYRLERNIFQKIVFQYRFKPLSNSFRHILYVMPNTLWWHISKSINYFIRVVHACSRNFCKSKSFIESIFPTANLESLDHYQACQLVLFFL